MQFFVTGALGKAGSRVTSRYSACGVWVCMMWCAMSLVVSPARGDTTVERGRYLFEVAGCKGCHTAEEGALLAGGRVLETPFGLFVAPNITPDKVTGIGHWTLDQFRQALRRGVSPGGEHYYPVFPYTSYTGMGDADVADLWAYLQTVPPVAQRNPDHQLPWPFRWRFLLLFWKWLFFDQGPWPTEPGRSDAYRRGAYIARALGHCGECHTPRNFLGAMDRTRELAGTVEGPEGGVIPNITPDPATGIGSWSSGDLESLLVMGMLPDADFVGAGMGEVVDNSTASLSAADRNALIAFLQQLSPISNNLSRDGQGAVASY